MINARKELQIVLENIKKSSADISWMAVYTADYSGDASRTFTKIEELDFEYDDWYGVQELHGVVVFSDKTWLERMEQNGNEWWAHMVPPKKEDWLKYDNS